MKLKFEEVWAETLAVGFVVLGFIISIVIQHRLLSYLTILLAGLVAGRIYYLKRYQQPILPFILMILSFLVGYLIGSVWVNRVLVLVLFLLGFWGSYYLHWKEIVVTFKSENFFK